MADTMVTPGSRTPSVRTEGSETDPRVEQAAARGSGRQPLRRKLAAGGRMVRSTPSPMRRSVPHDGTFRGAHGQSLLKERAHEAVRMKDEQLRVLMQVPGDSQVR